MAMQDRTAQRSTVTLASYEILKKPLKQLVAEAFTFQSDFDFSATAAIVLCSRRTGARHVSDVVLETNHPAGADKENDRAEKREASDHAQQSGERRRRVGGGYNPAGASHGARKHRPSPR